MGYSKGPFREREGKNQQSLSRGGLRERQLSLSVIVEACDQRFLGTLDQLEAASCLSITGKTSNHSLLTSHNRIPILSAVISFNFGILKVDRLPRKFLMLWKMKIPKLPNQEKPVFFASLLEKSQD